MVRRLPVRPVAGGLPLRLPINILLGLTDEATVRWKQPLFDLREIGARLDGSLSEMSGVLRLKIWEEDRPSGRVEPVQTSHFLGLVGDIDPQEDSERFDVVHYVGGFARGADDDPLVSLRGRFARAGELRDVLIKHETRLLILQSFEPDLRPDYSTLAERLAEFIAGGGGPAVLVVVGPEMVPQNRYLADVYSAILRNQPLDDVAQTNIDGSRILLLHGVEGTRLLTFDGFIDSLGERLKDYSALVEELLAGLQSLLYERSIESDTDDANRLQMLRPRVNAALRGLVDLTAGGWDESIRGALTLAEIAGEVEAINREFGWYSGEGLLHTRFDMLEYRINQLAPEQRLDNSLSLPPVTPGTLGPRASDPAELFTEVTVFFGTNRTRVAHNLHSGWGAMRYGMRAVAHDLHYGSGRDAMHYGMCAVSVPCDRRTGTISTPSILTLYRTDRAKHFVVQEIVEQDRSAFAAKLRDHVAGCSSHDALMFVHGFNVPFVSAVLRTAQIAADLNFPGTVILFSWPSKGSFSPLAYTHDETQARWTLPDLREFLELIAEESGATTIHLLAHSMGNRVLTEALGGVGAAAARRTGTAFHEVLLTAPDIDADTFVRDIAPSMLPVAKRVTLYASSNDKALAFSKRVHGYDRAGESGENIVLLEGVDTIDVSAIDTNLMGHSYYGDNRSVLADIFNVMLGQPVERRFGLKRRTKGPQSYWVFQP